MTDSELKTFRFFLCGDRSSRSKEMVNHTMDRMPRSAGSRVFQSGARGALLVIGQLERSATSDAPGL